MGVGAGLYMYVVVVQKFTFAISSPDEFLYINDDSYCYCVKFLHVRRTWSKSTLYQSQDNVRQ